MRLPQALLVAVTGLLVGGPGVAIVAVIVVFPLLVAYAAVSAS